MTPPQRPVPRPAKKSASPADRSEEFTETQRRLKREAAERRLKSTGPIAGSRNPGRSATGKSRGRG
jgi:hypothetical protein